jgi:hypothetical protein
MCALNLQNREDQIRLITHPNTNDEFTEGIDQHQAQKPRLETTTRKHMANND